MSIKHQACSRKKNMVLLQRLGTQLRMELLIWGQQTPISSRQECNSRLWGKQQEQEQGDLHYFWGIKKSTWKLVLLSKLIQAPSWRIRLSNWIHFSAKIGGLKKHKSLKPAPTWWLVLTVAPTHFPKMRKSCSLDQFLAPLSGGKGGPAKTL